MIDWVRVSELRNDIGAEDFAQVAVLFLEEVEGVLDTLHDTLPPDILADRFHFLKGGALNIGFSRLSELCDLAERMAVAGEPCAVPISHLRRAYAESKALFLSSEGGGAPAG